MYNDSYTVPTLSLTGSRSKKNIPTKDVYQSRGYNLEGSNVELNSNAYLERKQQTRKSQVTESRTSLNYYNMPPKPKILQNICLPMPKRQAKQISRNVYLNFQQQSRNLYPPEGLGHQRNQATTTQAMQKGRQVLGRSNSRGSLLRNPESRVQVHSQVMRQTNNMQFKKIDINKALFDRKLAKIFQQIQFYDQELDGLHKDSLADELEELQNIKEQSKQVHSKLLRDLNALIA